MKRKFIVLSLLIILVSLTACRSEDYMTLRGRVLDEQTQEGLAGVIVEIGDISIQTNTSGYFILEDIPVVEDLPLEDRLVKVGVRGYSLFVQELLLEEGDKSLDIRLRPLDKDEEFLVDDPKEPYLDDKEEESGPTDKVIDLAAESNIIKEEQGGLYDWERSVIRATGFGVSPSFIDNQSQGMIMAREASITAAQRRLVELIDGVQIDSKQRVRNIQIESDLIEKRVSGLLRGANIVEEKSIDDKTYKVVIELQFYGKDGIVEAILPSLGDSNRVDKVGEDGLGIADDDGYNYTGIIIDASSDLKPALAPNIYSSSGDLIYGIDLVQVEGVITDGLVAYSRTIADAQNSSRAGDNPLLIHAQGVKGDYNTDIVISDKDARVMRAAGLNGIFNERRVLIVLN